MPTKVCTVKAMVFPVVTYSCENWTIKKVECWRWCLQTEVLEKTLKNPLDCKEIRPVNPKGNQSWILVGGTDAEAETPIFGYLMWTVDSLEKSLMLGKIEDRRRTGCQKMRWLDGITDAMAMNMDKLREMVREREAWSAAVPGVTKSQTWPGDWPTTSV